VQADAWFQGHFDYAGAEVAARLGKVLTLQSSNLLDFGCGDGIISLSMSRKAHRVTGVDLTEAFTRLPDLALQNLSLKALPANLNFARVSEDDNLPFAAGYFDAGYAWSVFEHVQEPLKVLKRLRTCIKPGGYFLIQIEPLFYSPYGSHLRRLLDVPWAHLLLPEPEFVAQVSGATDNVPAEEKDQLYALSEFEAYKRYLLSEYYSLNKITSAELEAATAEAGFEILSVEARKLEMEAPSALTGKYAEDDLLTNEIFLLLRNP
jgi:SAM-dependent methyltransferase